MKVLARRRTTSFRSLGLGWLSAFACLGVLLGVSQASAAVPPDCRGLGQALVEHSCFHANLGPFEPRQATPGASATSATPNVNPTHTEYRVALPAGTSSVIYQPKQAGGFAFFTTYDIPLTLSGGSGAAPSVVYRTEETGCAALPLARVFELEADWKYTITFEVPAAGEVALVIEYVDDFLVRNGRDQDGDGYGDPNDAVMSVCVPEAGYAPNDSDCDDTNALIHPDAKELCGDDVDQNCNGLPDDEGFPCRLGEGACLASGKFVCNADGMAVCDVTELPPAQEQCNGLDDDCDGKIDEQDNLCTSEERPRCVRQGFSASCGCQFDSDCGDTQAWRCDATLGICEAVEPTGAGGSLGLGGNPAMEPGESDDGLGGEGGEGTGADGGQDEGSGCSCRAGSSGTSADAWRALALVFGLWIAGRRRGPLWRRTQP